MEQLRAMYHSGKTRAVHFRRRALINLRRGLMEHEQQLLSALKQDLGKCAVEAYVSEIGLVQAEIDFALRHLKVWTAIRKRPTPWLHFPAKSMIIPEPRGVVLIIGPWNYPLGLMLTPLVGAIAAGNCALLKPSELAPHTAEAIKTMIQATDPKDCFHVQLGDARTAAALLKQKWGHIFFTGSTRVGRLVMAAAAETLTPVTLELGGKSPCLVMDDVNFSVAAERIAWGKFLNAGQTCVAPDHVYVPGKSSADFTRELIRAVKRFYGPDAEKSDAYGRIINQTHFQRLTHYLKDGEVVYGGERNETDLYFSPTLLTNITPGAPVLQEEIFGPILPIIPYDNLDRLVHTLQGKSKPLALYIFTQKKALQKKVLSQLSSGTVGINDTVNQVATPYLPLGGVGESGMGQYHGKDSFDCFTHYRSVFTKNPNIRIGLRYPPYPINVRPLKKIFKWLFR